MSHLPSKLKVGLWFTVLALSVLIAGAVSRTALAGVTPHSVVQAVFEDGTNQFLPTSGIQVRGVVINNPWDMLDYSNANADFSGHSGKYSSKRSTRRDFGGTALYMRKKLPIPPPFNATDSYSDAEWTAEMDRINYPLGLAEPSLRRGDVVLVDALAPGLFFRGKYNINEQHSKDPLKDFNITIQDRDIDLTPLASPIDLTFLKNELDEFHLRSESPIG